jgi:hypothetical protein
MSEKMGEIIVLERQLTDREWVEAVNAALRAPIDGSLRNELVRELIKARQTVTARLGVSTSKPAA